MALELSPGSVVLHGLGQVAVQKVHHLPDVPCQGWLLVAPLSCHKVANALGQLQHPVCLVIHVRLLPLVQVVAELEDKAWQRPTMQAYVTGVQLQDVDQEARIPALNLVATPERAGRHAVLETSHSWTSGHLGGEHSHLEPLHAFAHHDRHELAVSLDLVVWLQLIS